jgi:hypothetical protein
MKLDLEGFARMGEGGNCEKINGKTLMWKKQWQLGDERERRKHK